MKEKRYSPGKNAEGYKDPTACTAIENITREERAEEKRANLLFRIFHEIVSLTDFTFSKPIILKNRKTGRYYKDRKD